MARNINRGQNLIGCRVNDLDGALTIDASLMHDEKTLAIWSNALSPGTTATAMVAVLARVTVFKTEMLEAFQLETKALSRSGVMATRIGY